MRPVRCLVCVAAFAAVLSGPGFARAMVADVPLVKIVQDSDLIVFVEVTVADAPVELELKPPGYRDPVTGWFRKYRVKVQRVLRDTAAKDRKGPLKDIEIFALAPQPARPGGPRAHVADGPMYPVLEAGGSYLLILRKFLDKPEYWLPAYFKNFYKADGKHVAAVERIADPSKWPWGKAVGGLQIAVLPSRTELAAHPTRKVNGRPASVYLQVMVAVRNTSKETVKLNLFRGDDLLRVYAIDAKGKTVEADLYGGVRDSRSEKSGPDAAVLAAKPGETVFIAPWGRDDFGFGVPLDLRGGKWKLYAVYESDRESKDGKLWKGKATSAAAEITVQQRGGRRVEPVPAPAEDTPPEP